MSFSPTPLRDDSEEHDDRRIRQVVDAYLRLRAIPGHDRDDLYQEGRIAWLRAKHTFRVDGGASRSTYIGSVVENRLRDLAREAHAQRRWSPGGPSSLDVPVTDDGDALADLLADDAPGPEQEAIRKESQTRLSWVRRRLPPRQREVLDVLLDEPNRSRTQIARDLGISRDTLYEDIRRIQDACRDAGLADALR